MKKLLMLGGLRYLKPVIEAAKKQGYYVITCDYKPDNPAHKYSDEFHNISILDKEAVLNLSLKLNIDGIMSFGVDPGVITAAYVAEEMGLPTVGPLKSVEILQNKALFREFLTKHGFNVPKAKGYTLISEAINDVEYFTWPVIVKPVDSAGSKGVSRVDNEKDLEEKIKYALKYSQSKEFIIEEFIEQKGFASDTDSFSIDGELIVTTFANQRFDIHAANPYTPSAYSWPSTISSKNQEELKNELQRLLKLLGMTTSIYNIEVREGKDGKAYIMECSPRGGGNRLSEMIRYASGVDLITAIVRAAVGDKILSLKQPVYNGYWAIIILHSQKEGVFKRLEIDHAIRDKNLFELDLWVKEGDEVRTFTGSNEAIGTLILRFENTEDLETALRNHKELISVIVN